MVQLDPSSVARAFVLSQPPSADEGEETQAAAGRTKDTRGKSFERAGDPSYLSTRDPPKLQRNKDGTYRYKGHAFKALVTEDGSVEFDDGYKQGSTVVFDMTDMMLRRRGEDPYRVEKRWFMEGTEELRADLLRRWQAKQLRAALVSLRGALIRIYENDQLTESQKASRVIAMFQDTANDEAGEAARSAIATFVSENMPEVDLPRSAQ